MDNSFDDFEVFLPKYLFPGERRDLFENLKQFPDKLNYYSNNSSAPLLQGDGWSGFIATDFETREAKPISGVVVSNSCDVDTSNRRPIEMNVLFAPLIRLARYANLLASGGKTKAEIEDTLSTIRLQRVSNIFYLPRIEGKIEESAALLDSIRPHPLKDFITRGRSRLFTLSQSGFYVFLFKLSIHFCRAQENVHRNPSN